MKWGAEFLNVENALFVILSAVRDERSRKIHDVMAVVRVCENSNALDSSTSFVPHCAQNDKESVKILSLMPMELKNFILYPSAFSLSPRRILQLARQRCRDFDALGGRAGGFLELVN